ncbi:hypothetical protein NW759_008963 [Fusarium solani]|nr:hypothetical protein NW759_008963 [Fusarium solani]
MSRMQTLEEKHPELFRPDLNIDRRKCTRTVPMEVLALGMSRTGTSCNDATSPHDPRLQRSIPRLRHVRQPLRSRALEGSLYRKYDLQPGQEPLGRKDFDQLLGHCGAICDYPANCFGPEMLEAYPESKVVLVERDVETWYKSFNDSIISTMYNPFWRFLAAIGARYVSEVDGLTTMWFKYHFKATTKEEIQANVREGYK